MANRKFYESEEYQARTIELEKALNSATILYLTTDKYTIQGEATEDQHFIPFQDMGLFEPFADFDCRRIKLINFNRPAISLTYFRKHKYFVKKKLKSTEIEGILEAIITELKEEHSKLQEELTSLTDPELQNDKIELILQLARKIKQFMGIYSYPHHYQFAASNYERGYFYSYLAYKYRMNGKVKSANTHLIKNIYDKEGNLMQRRSNIVFVDVEALLRSPNYSNKLVVDFLKNFSQVVARGKYDFYIREI